MSKDASSRGCRSSITSGLLGTRSAVGVSLAFSLLLLALTAQFALAQYPYPKGVGREWKDQYQNCYLLADRCSAIGSAMRVRVREWKDDSPPGVGQAVHLLQYVKFIPSGGPEPPPPPPIQQQMLHNCGWFSYGNWSPGHDYPTKIRRFCYTARMDGEGATESVPENQAAYSAPRDYSSPGTILLSEVGVYLEWEWACKAAYLRGINPLPDTCPAPQQQGAPYPQYPGWKWRVVFELEPANTGFIHDKGGVFEDKRPELAEDGHGFYSGDTSPDSNGDFDFFTNYFVMLPKANFSSQGTWIQRGDTYTWVSDSVEEPPNLRVDVYQDGQPGARDWYICSGDTIDGSPLCKRTPTPVPTPYPTCAACPPPAHGSQRGIYPPDLPLHIDATEIDDDLSGQQADDFKDALRHAVREWNLHSPVQLFDPNIQWDGGDPSLAPVGEVNIVVVLDTERYDYGWRIFDREGHPCDIGINGFMARTHEIQDPGLCNDTYFRAGHLLIGENHATAGWLLPHCATLHEWQDYKLRSVFTHELGHAVFSGKHTVDAGAPEHVCKPSPPKSLMCEGMDQLDHLQAPELEALRCLYEHLAP